MKDYDNWNKKKKEANEEIPRLYTVREIWWCRFGVNIGFEQDGNGKDFLRPAVIVRSFGANICLVIPLTTSKQKHPLRITIGKIQGENASVILSQLRIFDTRRLVEKMGFLDKNKFNELRKAVRNLF